VPIFAATAEAAVPLLVPTMHRMRSGLWRKTWFVSWGNWDSRASQLLGMIAAVVLPIGLRSITRIEWNVSLYLTFFRPQKPGRADKKLATAFWPWSLLAQPEPLPERLVSAAPDAVVDDALGGWGSPANAFGSEVRAAYIEALRDPARVHAICEEYRAAATLDHEHDLEDRHAGRRIACPVLVLWSGRGPLGTWYAEVGGPLALWRAWATNVSGAPLDAGHFFPEEIPEQTAAELSDFFG